MERIRWTVALLAFAVAGFMALDGSRALVKGDYVTPKSGEHAGQLGPWADVVSAVGVEPRSTLMKSVFAVYGFGWLLVIGFFLSGVGWGWRAMLVAAVGALWYLPFGTLLAALQIVLLLLPAGRELAGG